VIRESIGPYTVQREIGSGGMGTVYLVQRDGERFALKVVHEQFAATPQLLERFHREVAAGSAVDHPNVVRTLDHGQHDGRHFMVMEYVEGRTLGELLDALIRVPEALVREIARQSAEGLAAIHASGIVHRDIKPDNILITDANEIRIMDLGVAKLMDATVQLTATGQFAGSALYASPEQFQGAGVGPAADLYSLGVVLYELASGKNPFRADELVAVIRNHLTLKPEPLDRVNGEVSGFLAAVVAQLLQKDAANRFGAATELCDVLREQERSSWWAAREASALAAARPKIPVRRETALVGRKAVLAELQDAWARASRGEGGMLTLAGEAGIGKTRLADAFLDEIDPSAAHLLYGAFRPTGGLGGLIEAFVGHFGASSLESALAEYFADTPGIVPALKARLTHDAPPPGAPHLTGDALRAIVGRLLQAMAAQKPVVLVLDDLHLARQEAQDMLLSLSRAAVGHRILLVGLTQPQGVTAGRPIELSRLGLNEVQALLTEMLSNAPLAERMAPRIREESDGVPLAALELVHGLEHSGALRRDEDGVATAPKPISVIAAPESLRELLEQRLDELAEDDRELLDAACVQGPEFDPGLLAATLETKRVRVLRQLASIERRTGMVHAQGDRYRFDLKQVQEALEHNLASELRREYHSMLCEAHLERAGEPDAEFLARHALLGTQPTDALQWLAPALKSLGAAYRHTEFLELARAALDIDGLVTGNDRGGMLLDLAEQLDFLGQPDEQRIALAEATAVADDPGVLARVRYTEAVMAYKTGLLADAESAFAESAELARAAGDRVLAARATGSRGVAMDHSGRHEEALPYLREHLSIAEADEDKDNEKVARQNLAICFYRLQRFDEAEAGMQRACALAQELGDRRGEAHAHSNLSLIATLRGEGDKARRLLQRSVELAREIGDRRSEMIGTLNLGALDLKAGFLAEAAPRLEIALSQARETGDPRIEGHAEIYLSTIQNALGRLDRALERIDGAARAFGETKDADQQEECRRRRARLLFDLGRGPEPDPADEGPYAPLFSAAANSDEEGALDFDNPAYGIASVWTRLRVLHKLYQGTGKTEYLDRAREQARTIIDHAPKADRAFAVSYYADLLE